MQSRPEVFRTQFLIVQIQQGFAAGIENMEALDFCCMSKNLIKNTKFLEHHHPGRLQQETGPNGFALFGPLEQNNVVPKSLQ